MHDSAKSCSDGCISRDRRRFWGAHAARVLVSAARRNELDPSYHKPLMMHEFHDHLIRDSRRARAQPVLELGSVPLPPARECFRSCHGADRPLRHRRWQRPLPRY